jgi:hypothetical protein
MSLIIQSLPPQPATNTFFDNNEATSIQGNWKIDGVQVMYGPCKRPTVHGLVACIDDELFDYTTAGSISSYKFQPFRLRQVLSCNPLQWANDPKAFFDVLTESFNNGAHVGMAQAFWDGGASWNGLTQIATGIPANTSIGGAIGILIQQMSVTGSGSGGTIHMSPYLANVAASEYLIYRRGQRLYTVVGDYLVVADGGYSGNGPGVTPGVPATAVQQWIYVTQPVYYKLDKLEFAAGFDLTKYINRGANHLVVPVEADAIFFFDPCAVFGVSVNLGTVE